MITDNMIKTEIKYMPRLFTTTSNKTGLPSQSAFVYRLMRPQLLFFCEWLLLRTHYILTVPCEKQAAKIKKWFILINIHINLP